MIQERPPSRPLPDEVPWVPEPSAPPLLWPRRLFIAGPAKWTRYSLKATQTCTTCVQVLLDHQKEPYPRPPGHPNRATKVRTVGAGKDKQQTWHCSAHGVELEQQDAQWARNSTFDRELAQHLARGRHR